MTNRENKKLISTSLDATNLADEIVALERNVKFTRQVPDTVGVAVCGIPRATRGQGWGGVGLRQVQPLEPAMTVRSKASSGVGPTLRRGLSRDAVARYIGVGATRFDEPVAPLPGPSTPVRHPRTRRKRPALIPSGAWPRRMSAELAAGYCGEATVGAFLARVGNDYPLPRVSDGRRKLWLRDDLDSAILPDELRHVADVAADL